MTGRIKNRLADETSPYLLQHAANPVAWFPWGNDAFQKARSEDKPVFLSVGYSTCHWCHVMAHESFENDAVAALLNEHFVPVKVDREERPDVDDIYMTATQLLTGRGGWPNSVWLTPDRRPWYAGTYFPPDPFVRLLNALHEAWTTQRREIEAQADRLAQAIRDSAPRRAMQSSAAIERTIVHKSINAFKASFDPTYGGQNGAPKFPPHTMLQLLMYEHQVKGAPAALDMAIKTLDGMAAGGIHDHLGGGFHRYSTDSRWLVPHFEKMLYDNAQLASAYAVAYSLTGAAHYKETAAGICDWVLRDMTASCGAFHSAIDADSEGVEGKFYVWTEAEIKDVLGPEEAHLLCEIYHVAEPGNYHDEATGQLTGQNILYLTAAPVNATRWVPVHEAGPRLRAARHDLLQQRNKRVWPHIDDKILVGWNGLMISGLAHCGQALACQRYIEAASRAADFLLDTMWQDGRLHRMCRNGNVRGLGYLNDYAFLAKGLLDLFAVTGRKDELDKAHMLLACAHGLFADEAGGFCQTSNEHETLLLRPRDPMDRAIPSGNGIMAQAFADHGDMAQDRASYEAARATVSAFLESLHRGPQYSASLALAAARCVDTALAVRPGPGAADTPDASASTSSVRAELYTDKSALPQGTTLDIALRIEIAEGCYLAGGDSAEVPTSRPTTLTIDTPDGWSVDRIMPPAVNHVSGAADSSAPGTLHGTVWFTARLTCGRGATQGPAKLVATLSFQVCDAQACRMPTDIHLALNVTVTEAAPPVCRHHRIFGSLREKH